MASKHRNLHSQMHKCIYSGITITAWFHAETMEETFRQSYFNWNPACHLSMWIYTHKHRDASISKRIINKTHCKHNLLYIYKTFQNNRSIQLWFRHYQTDAETPQTSRATSDTQLLCVIYHRLLLTDTAVNMIWTEPQLLQAHSDCI